MNTRIVQQKRTEFSNWRHKIYWRNRKLDVGKP